MTEEYRRYMRSPQWQKKREERLEIDGHKCAMCGRPAARCRNGLQVHHIHYKTLTRENPYTDLVSLCPSCHRRIHNFYNRIREEPKEESNHFKCGV